MEKVLTLSSCEILHIIGSIGKDDFFGISDGFEDMDDFEVNSAIMKAENSLIDKGYAELDFDGNFSVLKEISDTLLICAECEKMLDIQMTNLNNATIKKTIYAKGNELVEFSVLSDSLYRITRCELNTVKQCILDNLNWINERTSIPGRFFFTKKVLSDAKNTLGFGMEEQLVKECKNTNTVKVISNGLNGNSNYYSFTLYDFETETIEVNSLIVLNSADGSLEMEPESKDEGSSYLFKPIDFETVKGRIGETLKKLDVGEESFE